MEYITITLRANDFEKDLKIPSFISVAEFGKVMSEKYKISANQFQAEPAGILLKSDDSFANQGIYEGAILTVA